jgi:hypothetical protein
MLVTGNRLNDSKILSNITFFNLSANEHKKLEINLRKDVPGNNITGKVNLKEIINLFDKTKAGNGRELSPITNINDKGLVIIWIEPDKEPTKHIFNDLPMLKHELDAWGGYFLFLTSSAQDGNSFNPERIKGLPEKTLFGTDDQLAVFKNSVYINPSPDVRLPFVVMTDRDGNILFNSTGYRIGIGEQILKHIK